MIVPLTSDLNFTPNSAALSGPSIYQRRYRRARPDGAVRGTCCPTAAPTVTVTPAPGVSRLPLSSIALLLIVTEPERRASTDNSRLLGH